MKGNRNRIVLSGLPEGHFSEQFTLENAVFARENPFDIYGGEVEAFVEGDRTGNVFAFGDDIIVKLRLRRTGILQRRDIHTR